MSTAAAQVFTHLDGEKGQLYYRLKAFARGLPNDEFFSRMISSWAFSEGALTANLGLKPEMFQLLLERHYPGIRLPALPRRVEDTQRAPERDDLYKLIIAHRAKRDISEIWVAGILTAGCMGADHLWQDLGLWSRDDLSMMIRMNFPVLSVKNNKNMKWKKFFYKQLCNQEGIYVCRSPSCEVCVDYNKCFGPED